LIHFGGCCQPRTRRVMEKAGIVSIGRRLISAALGAMGSYWSRCPGPRHNRAAQSTLVLACDRLRRPCPSSSAAPTPKIIMYCVRKRRNATEETRGVASRFYHANLILRGAEGETDGSVSGPNPSRLLLFFAECALCRRLPSRVRRLRFGFACSCLGCCAQLSAILKEAGQ
jgi:hypothetical protein